MFRREIPVIVFIFTYLFACFFIFGLLSLLLTRTGRALLFFDTFVAVAMAMPVLMPMFVPMNLFTSMPMLTTPLHSPPLLWQASGDFVTRYQVATTHSPLIATRQHVSISQ